MQQAEISSEHSIVVAVAPADLRRLQIRRAASAVAVLVGCALWYLTFARLHVAVEAMPWYLTCAFIAILCGLAVVRQSGAQRWVLARVGFAWREPLSLLETWALTYCATAVLLYAWVLVHSLMPSQEAPRVVHVVDIQLEDGKDFADRKSPMPGTEEQAEMHKRRSDLHTVQGSFAKSKPASLARVEKPILQQREKPVQQVVAPPPKPMPSAIPAPVPVAKASPVPPKPTKQFIMEEVQPPEMVEMIENDGVSDAARVFESGGSSIGGRGAANELSDYIKALHKRIKANWSPPRGQTREARILFRLRKDGRLAFLRVTSSSGDPETDEAAMKAVSAAAKTGKELPDDYAMPYLDVQYTFKYTADELKEVEARVTPFRIEN